MADNVCTLCGIVMRVDSDQPCINCYLEDLAAMGYDEIPATPPSM